MGLVQSGSHKSGGCVFISLQVYTNYSNFQIVIIYVYISCSRYFQNSRIAPAYGSHDHEKAETESKEETKQRNSKSSRTTWFTSDTGPDLCLVLICMSGICSHWPPLLTSFSPRIMCLLCISHPPESFAQPGHWYIYIHTLIYIQSIYVDWYVTKFL